MAKCKICGNTNREGIELHDKWICIDCCVACSIIVKCGQIETCDNSTKTVIDETAIDKTAIIHEDTVIGEGCVIKEKAIIGTEGLALSRRNKNRFCLRGHKGKVIIKNEVLIGANTIVQRGVTRDTVIGEGTKIGPMCNIGHDTIIGKNCRIAGMNQINGYVEIGNDVYMAPGCNILNRIKIGSGVFIGIGSLVMHNVPENTTVYGRPAKPKKKSITK